MFSYVLNPMESGPCIGGLNEIGRGIHFNVVRSCVKSTPAWVDFIRPISLYCRVSRSEVLYGLGGGGRKNVDKLRTGIGL